MNADEHSQRSLNTFDRKNNVEVIVIAPNTLLHQGNCNANVTVNVDAYRLETKAQVRMRGAFNVAVFPRHHGLHRHGKPAHRVSRWCFVKLRFAEFSCTRSVCNMDCFSCFLKNNSGRGFTENRFVQTLYYNEFVRCYELAC